MPRTCTVCGHDRRHDVELALVRRDSYRDIARRFALSKDALGRHAKEHLPELLSEAHRAEEYARADDLLRQVGELQSKTLNLLLKAEEAGELRTALSAIREARGNLELLAKLRGELDERPQVNVLITPEVQAIILEALRPYTRARLAVADALGAVEEVAAP
jgi:hypothetical protein